MAAIIRAVRILACHMSVRFAWSYAAFYCTLPAMLHLSRTFNARRVASACLAVLISACSGIAHPPAVSDSSHLIDLHVLAFNDLHGHLHAPGLSSQVPDAGGNHQHTIPTGGMPWLAGTIEHLRTQYPHHAVVSAGDLVGASPLISSFFLDEPTIEAANALRVDFSAVGNHEFDRGWQELMRLATGGCERLTQRTPCRVSPDFGGAKFPMLAANVLHASGATLLPATGMKEFEHDGHRVKLGFIGMTLRDTPKLVMSSAVQGLHFAPEAETANALVPALLAQGADIIALLLHEGGYTQAPAFSAGCQGLSGAIVPILEQLDPRISVVVSGHTHQSYVCDYATLNPDNPFLLTSAGLYGTQLSDIRLRWDPRQRKLHSRSAHNWAIPANAQAAATPSPAVLPSVQPSPAVQAIIARYQAALGEEVAHTVGQILSPHNAALSQHPGASGEIQLGNLIADAQVWAMQQPQLGGADISFMHSGGVRAPLQPGPDGSVRFDQLYAIQPFANTLIGMTLTGQQIWELLEDTYTTPKSASGRTRVLSPNAAFSWRHDAQAPRGAQVHDVLLHGKPIDRAARYRVIVSSFLAEGGDRYAIFGAGTERVQGPLDIDALESYLRAHSPLKAPNTQRIR